MKIEIEKLLAPYNPWLGDPNALDPVPVFERPVLEMIKRDLKTQRQILQITGPRRVGKTTLVRQLIRRLLKDGRPPDQLVYYSLDDPSLLLSGIDRGRFIEALMLELRSRSKGQKVCLFLDEVQRLEGWELYLKKYYDLQYPIRFVISGSASSPIFKRSRESLMGRVKDYHVLPFSFREFSMYRLQSRPDLLGQIEEQRSAGASLMGMLAGGLRHLDLEKVTIQPLSDIAWQALTGLFAEYIRDGGFPEVWDMPTWEQKIEYLYDNQVKRVIFEDLVLAAEFRKPEQLKRFYVSLLERPGQEANFNTIAGETGVGLQQVQKYLPLLEMTDLVTHIEKFRKSALRVRRGNVKFYLVDLALRNAVLRLRDDVLSDAQTMGLYAENLVFNALRKWPGLLSIDFYREKDGEVDFVAQTKPNRYLPIEVKYRDSIQQADLLGLWAFKKKFRAVGPFVVTKRKDDFGWIGTVEEGTRCFSLPLIHFLLLID